MPCDNLDGGIGWEVAGGFQREGTYAYLWLVHADVWQRPTQYCKAIVLRLKVNKFQRPIPFNCLILSVGILCYRYVSLFNLSLMERHVGCFQLLIIRNKSALNI